MSKVSGHIVFDLDGTLINSMETALKTLSNVFSAHSESLWSNLFSKKDFFHKCLSRFDVLADALNIQDKNLIKALRNEWYQVDDININKYTLFPGWKRILNDLYADNFYLYVWTARSHQSAVEILSRLKIIDLFIRIRGGDEQGRKPNPLGLKRLLRTASLKKTIMVGDSQSDIEGAFNYNIASIGAYWCQFSSKERLRRAGATFLAPNNKECVKIIKRYFN